MTDGAFRDQLWLTVMKQEAAYETTPGMLEVFKKHLKTIPSDYDYSSYQNEKEDLRGPEEDTSPKADPLERISPLSKYSVRQISQRPNP